VISQRREAQLAVLLDVLEKYPSAIVAGDFNYDPQLDSPDPPSLQRYTDCWTATNQPTSGVTFDTITNPTATLTAKGLKQRRYDRVCVRGMSVTAARLAGAYNLVTTTCMFVVTIVSCRYTA
jgi:endonuclease/exonuclease/phosphatase family metal-dependent hydrolase